MYKFFATTLFVLFLFVSGCAQGSFGTVRYSTVFDPIYTIDVVNNTNVPMDVWYGGNCVKLGLTPGETFTLQVWQFRSGSQKQVTVKAYKMVGPNEKAYLGTASRRFSLYTRYGYRQGGTPTRHEVWTVDRIQPFTSY